MHRRDKACLIYHLGCISWLPIVAETLTPSNADWGSRNHKNKSPQRRRRWGLYI